MANTFALAARGAYQELEAALRLEPQLVCTVDASGRTPLFAAPDAATVRTLVHAGVNIHMQDKYGCTALHLASSVGNVEVVDALVNEGAILTAADLAGNTPLHSAKSVAVVSSLTHTKNPVVLTAVNKEGCTPLHTACKLGRGLIAKALISAGSDVNAVDHFGRTPLLYVAERGDVDVAEALIAAGANPGVVDRLGWNALHFAALGMWPQHESHAGIMRLVLSHCGNSLVNAPDTRGAVPLHVCTDLIAAEILIQADANVHCVDQELRTPLHTVGDSDISLALVHAGAALDARDCFGRTPLHMCTGEQKAHIMCKLGADVNALDAAGQTPVDLAAAAERPLVIAELRAVGGLTSEEFKSDDRRRRLRYLLLFAALCVFPITRHRR